MYDLFGNFKRRLKHKEGLFYTRIGNFDQDNLICHDNYFPIDGEVIHKNYFFTVSKQDGSVKEISIPYEKKIITTAVSEDKAWSATPSTFYPIVPCLNKWLLVESASDTVYNYSPYHTMTPFIVRTPAIQSLSPEIFLFPSIITDRYYFMEAVTKELDLRTNKSFPSTSLVYDKQENKIFRYTLYDGNFIKGEPVKWGYDITVVNDSEIAFLQKIESSKLVDLYENGKLSGKLKEIAATLEEESNPVIMIVKHKK